MSSAPPLLSAAGAGQPSRSASCAVAKPTRWFHVFRIDGYSWTKTLPGAERITSPEYKFSLLDLAGKAAYELPAETGLFTAQAADNLGCGYAGFITKVELERRRDSLLKDDCLAIHCDVGVTELGTMNVGPSNRHGRRRSRSDSDDSESDSDDEKPLPCKRGGQPSDDKEYIRRCLATKRRRQ